MTCHPAFRDCYEPELQRPAAAGRRPHGKTLGFEETDTYRAIKKAATASSDAPPTTPSCPRSLDSPKFSRTRSTAWFAQSVDRRYQSCLAAPASEGGGVSVMASSRRSRPIAQPIALGVAAAAGDLLAGAQLGAACLEAVFDVVAEAALDLAVERRERRSGRAPAAAAPPTSRRSPGGAAQQLHAYLGELAVAPPCGRS